MEHNNELWSCPYNDEKYGEELGASFKYFKEFIKCPQPRTLIGFHEVLANKLANNGRKRIPSYAKIREYSAKWKWMLRAKAYDDYIRDVEDEEMKQTIRDIRNNAIQDIQNRFEMHRELEKELKSNTEMNTNQKIYGFAKDTEGFRNNVSAFNDLVNEGKTKLDADVQGDTNINIEGMVSLSEKEAKAKEYFEELEKEFSE